MKKSYYLLIFLLFIFTACSLAKQSEKEEIIIGFNADQTSSGTGVFGRSARMGFEIAVKEINKNGGVMGRQIKPLILDDEADPVKSKVNMEELVNSGALAVIGPANSANAFHWLDYVQENETTVVIPIATASGLTSKFADRPRNFIFRVMPIETVQSTLYIAWLINQTNNGKIAVIHDSTLYGTTGLDYVNEVLARWGKRPVAIESFDPESEADRFLSIMEKVKNKEVDGLVVICYPDALKKLMDAKTEVGDFSPFIVGTSAIASPVTWQLLGEKASEISFVIGVTDEVNEGTTYLKEKSNEYFGDDPENMPCASHSHDSVYLLKQAIEDAKSLDRVAVRDALEKVENVEGVVKYYEKPFSKKDHEALGLDVLFMAHWKNGRYEKLPNGEPGQLTIR